MDDFKHFFQRDQQLFLSQLGSQIDLPSLSLGFN